MSKTNAMNEFSLIIKKITWRKIWNAAVRGTGILLSRISGRYVNIGMPWSYSIEPCDICNLKCRECVSGQGVIRRRRGRIDINDYKMAVDQIAPYATNLFLYFQGEPTMHQQFAQMVEYASANGIYTATSTNGHFIDSILAEKIVKSGLGKIIVSIDGYNQETYESYRVGGHLSKVLDAIRNLSDAKKRLGSKTPLIEAQTLVTRINEDGLQKVRDLAMEAGADAHYLKTMQIENQEDFDTFKTTIDKYSRYDSRNQLKKPVGFCSRAMNSAVISIDMDVLPCCYDKDAELKLGNLREAGIVEIIKSDKASRIITAIERQRDQRPAMCKNCGG